MSALFIACPRELEAAFRRATSRRIIKRRPRASNHIPLTEAASQLGVTREHLSRVLHGHRQSASLTRRFRALEKSMLKTKSSAH